MGGSFIGIGLIFLVIGPLLIEGGTTPIDRRIAVGARLLFNIVGVVSLVWGVVK
jgi:hypothetical protein